MEADKHRRKLFFGAAIQGLSVRGERSHVYSRLLDAIKEEGFSPVSEHTATSNMTETARKLEDSLGPLPPPGLERSIYVRNRMIELVESDIEAAIFEVSSPSLGTGIEMAHAYLRPRMGLTAVPVLALYQTNHWPHGLSSMIRGITRERVECFSLDEYADSAEAVAKARAFLRRL